MGYPVNIGQDSIQQTHLLQCKIADPRELSLAHGQLVERIFFHTSCPDMKLQDNIQEKTEFLFIIAEHLLKISVIKSCYSCISSSQGHFCLYWFGLLRSGDAIGTQLVGGCKESWTRTAPAWGELKKAQLWQPRSMNARESPNVSCVSR